MLMELDRDFFSPCHQFYPGAELFHEDLQGQKKLLVTIGDSWVWGQKLPGVDINYLQDHPSRLSSIYGFHLKNLVGQCDWVNIAMPGTANRWIVDVAMRFLLLADQLHYEKIIISVVGTDIGRDIDQRGQPSQYSLSQTAITFEREYLLRLSKLDHDDRLLLIYSKNYNSTFPENVNILKHHLSKRWVDIAAENCPQKPVPPDCSIIYHSNALSAEDKSWALENSMPLGNAMMDFLFRCSLLNPESGHPTAQCHELWAQYIFDYIKTNRLC